VQRSRLNYGLPLPRLAFVSLFPSTRQTPTSRPVPTQLLTHPLRPSANVSVAESPLLLEKTPLEWLPIYGDRQLVGRITGFTKFVETDIKDVAVVVGHSQYFKKMLGMDKKFDNCDIWECYYTFEDEEKGEGAGKWEVKGRLYKGNEVGDDQGTSCAKEAKV